MLERKGHLPGYTGYIPSMDKLEEEAANNGPRPHIPNYQGFVPGIRSENLFGKTFGNITEDSSLKKYNKGIDLPIQDKYKSVTTECFTNQTRIPVMPLKPKKYPEAPRDPSESIPKESMYKFFGVRGAPEPEEMEQSLCEFYGGLGGIRNQEGPQEDMATAYAKFYDENEVQDPTRVPKLSYEEARQLASENKPK